MRLTVGVADMKLSSNTEDSIVTHALGSCVGVAIYDPDRHVGGILHFMLPMSQVDKAKAEANPFMFGDTGIPLLFEEAYKLGARKEHLRVVIAGGAQVFAQEDTFAIGKRNVVITRKLFWKNNVLIAAENVGGSIPRTMYLEMATGHTWFSSRGQETEL